MTFSESVETFVAASPWLADEHEPDLVTLRYLALKLDGDPDRPAPLIQQFGLTIRGLRKQAPAATEESDPLERLLSDADR